MLKSERFDAIVTLVNKEGTITVNQVADLLDVSDMTVRRDLQELSEQERLVRVHGGARSLNDRESVTIKRELTHAEKSNVHSTEKSNIAQNAFDFIEEGQTIFLGPGTTIAALARLIPNMKLRVITNSLPVIEILSSKPNVDVCTIGGALRHSTGAFVGPIAENAISSLGIDTAFIGANGIYNKDISTSTSSEGTLQMKVLDRAAKRYLLADSSKIGRRDFYTFYNLEDLDCIITDKAVSDKEKEDLSQYTKVIC